jgi:hypothetical protein
MSVADVREYQGKDADEHTTGVLWPNEGVLLFVDVGDHFGADWGAVELYKRHCCIGVWLRGGDCLWWRTNGIPEVVQGMCCRCFRSHEGEFLSVRASVGYFCEVRVRDWSVLFFQRDMVELYDVRFDLGDDCSAFSLEFEVLNVCIRVACDGIGCECLDRGL